MQKSLFCKPGNQLTGESHMMRHIAGSILTALAMSGISQAQQPPPATPPGNSGQQGNQNPGRPTANPSGQTGQAPTGQPGQQGGQNPVGQPGQNPVGQPGRTPTGQPGQGTGQNPIGQPGQPINGQPRQNPVGQGAAINAQLSTVPIPSLYQNADVRRTLNLTTDQVNRLNALNTQLQQRSQNEIARFNSLSPGQRAVEMERLRSNQTNEFYLSSNGIFSPDQLRRYQQLEHQYQGPAAFSDPEIRKQLHLTDDQLRRFQALQNETRRPQSFLQNQDGTVRNNGPQEFQAYRQRQSEQMDAILSQEQRDRWQRLIGERYRFEPYVSSVFVR
jgi:hypothetical protein